MMALAQHPRTCSSWTLESPSQLSASPCSFIWNTDSSRHLTRGQSSPSGLVKLVQACVLHPPLELLAASN